MTAPVPLPRTTLLGSLPEEWPEADLLALIQTRNRGADRCIVALDDDPTGTQTVHNVSVLTRWETRHLAQALASGDPALYILTNTRSVPLEKAQQINRAIARNLTAAARATGRAFVTVSRSDSTLRGHFPGEVEALVAALQQAGHPAPDAVCLIPFFLEGGRLTVDDIHWVAEGDLLIPAGQTPYAQDPAFGYQNSHLPAWVVEKTAGNVPLGAIQTISLAHLRKGGPEGVTAALMGPDARPVVVINAASYRDLEVFTAGWQRAEELGRRYIFRTAASFVRVAAGIPPRPTLTPAELSPGRPAGGGLIVFGSFVPKSTAQLEVALELNGLRSVALDSRRLFVPDQREAIIVRAAHDLEKALQAGQDALIYTSREVITADDPDENLRISQSISAALMAVVRRLQTEPRYVIGKGGVTSSDLATAGMHVVQARVLGQALPGVPVWRLGGQSRWPGMPYIVFPGNVGDDQAVAEVIRLCRPNK